MTTHKNLYWVTTPLNEEDWFIIAKDAKAACKFHEHAEGFERGYAKAKEICSVEKKYEKGEAYWASLNILEDLGFKILSEAPYRILQKDSKIYQEGSTVKLVVMERSYNKEGIYIVNMANTNLYKIGITKDFSQRLRNLQTGNPFIIEVHNFYPMKTNTEMESFLHKRYQHKKLSGEWFELTYEDLNNIHDFIVGFKTASKS
jgi:hypothetical protein